MSRYEGRTLTIGILSGGLSDPFARGIAGGAKRAAEEVGGIRVVVLPGKYIGSSYVETAGSDAQFSTLYACPFACHPDGLIVMSGSLGSRADVEENLAFLRSYGSIPMVLVAADYEGYVSINYDNETGIREAMEYMTEVLGLRNICMLGSSMVNVDARERKLAWQASLAEHRISYEERRYLEGDLSGTSDHVAGQLLDQNPDAEAIFCVNDEEAFSVYRAMKQRGLTPGGEIRVLGFDNEPRSAIADPPLASIGADPVLMGERALVMLLQVMRGGTPESERIPTGLVIRASLDPFATHAVDESFLQFSEEHIDLLFDEIFYLYRSERRTREMVDLRRCFVELVTRLMDAVHRRYLDEDGTEELQLLVDVFFTNGCMRFSDTETVLHYLALFQRRLSERGSEDLSIAILSPFFAMIRERVAKESARALIFMREQQDVRRELLRQLLLIGQKKRGERKIYETFLRTLQGFGVRNALLYEYEKPILHAPGDAFEMPEELLLVAVMRDGDRYLLPPERQRRRTETLFREEELPDAAGTTVALPVFYGETLYGIFVTELNEDVFDCGDVLVSCLGAAYA